MENEKRLIDANALNWGRCPTDAKLAKAWLDEAPTVDAVEVVRCKDCQHRGNIICPMYNEEYIRWDEDGYEEGEWVTHDYSCDNGFCHMGEREEECD